MEVYHYTGRSCPTIPRKLVIDGSVLSLPRSLCENGEQLQEVDFHEEIVSIGPNAFRNCRALMNITLCSTMRTIDESAFEGCESLKTIEFVPPPRMNTRPRLHIRQSAFSSCRSLQRVHNLQWTLKRMGKNAFMGCYSLVVADFAGTSLSEIPVRSFQKCISLQSVRLPKSVTCIRDRAFIFCCNLVTVEIPRSTTKMDVEVEAFYDCGSLTNINFPSTHTIHEGAFGNCTQLQTRLGPGVQQVQDLFFRLDNRLLFHPIHEMCYYSSSSTTATVDDLRRCIHNQERDELLSVDEFHMTPLHVLCSLVVPRHDLFDVMLANYPSLVLNWKDANDKRFTDYLLANSTSHTSRMLEMTAQTWMLAPLAQWSTPYRRKIVSQKVQYAVDYAGADKDRRTALFMEAFGIFQNYEVLEALSILELTLWKIRIRSGWNRDDTKRNALDREHCLHQCGSSVILPSVGSFLGMESIPSSSDRVWRKQS